MPSTPPFTCGCLHFSGPADAPARPGRGSRRGNLAAAGLTREARLRADTRFAPWLFTVARNLYVSYCRARALEEAYGGPPWSCGRRISATVSPFDETAASELERRIERALARMPATAREVLLPRWRRRTRAVGSRPVVCGVTPEALRQRLQSRAGAAGARARGTGNVRARWSSGRSPRERPAAAASRTGCPTRLCPTRRAPNGLARAATRRSIGNGFQARPVHCPPPRAGRPRRHRGFVYLAQIAREVCRGCPACSDSRRTSAAPRIRPLDREALRRFGNPPLPVGAQRGHRPHTSRAPRRHIRREKGGRDERERGRR